MWQMAYILSELEAFNADFSMPVLFGCSLYEGPSSDMYHLLATGYRLSRPAPPPAPARPAAAAIAVSMVRVTWQPVVSEDAPLLRYEIERRLAGVTGGGFQVCLGVDPALSSAVVARLSSGTSYQFRVVAVNEFGRGRASLHTDTVTTPAATGAFVDAVAVEQPALRQDRLASMADAGWVPRTEHGVPMKQMPQTASFLGKRIRAGECSSCAPYWPSSSSRSPLPDTRTPLALRPRAHARGSDVCGAQPPRAVHYAAYSTRSGSTGWD